MPKIVDYTKRKQDICTVAISVFIENGYHGTNLSQIAKLCGLGRTTIYKYFKDKDEIFLYAIDDVFTGFEKALDDALADSGGTSIDRISRSVESIVAGSISNREKMLIVLDLLLRMRRNDRAFERDIRARIIGLKDRFEKLINMGIESGEIKELNARAMAFAVISLVEMFVLHGSFYDDTFAFSDAIESARILIKGLAVRES